MKVVRFPFWQIAGRLPLFFLAALSSSAAPASRDTYPTPVTVIDHGHGVPQHWVRYAQCQMRFDVGDDKADRIPMAVDPLNQETKIGQCLQMAIAEKADVLILPEVAVALPSVNQQRVFANLSQAAQEHRMLIIAGSYYDAQRRSRIAYFGPGWTEQGFKIKQSRFEVSPVSGYGMQQGTSIYLLKTGFGNIAAITCVDLISDGVQAAVRRLIDEHRLDVLVNINYNPASWEFLIEANSIARRHPVFVSITNAAPETDTAPCDPARNNDNGYCYGNSAIFASLNKNYGLADIFSAQLIPSHFLIQAPEVPRDPDDRRQLAYDYMVADTGAFGAKMLLYDLNMWFDRVAYDTTAPDQGYPTIRNIKIVDLP